MNIVVAEAEYWVYDKELSEEDGGKKKCFMAHTDGPLTYKESRGSGTFEDDLAKATKDSKKQDWDSLSLY